MLSYVPGFQKFPEIEIVFTNTKNKKKYTQKDSGENFFIYSNNDDISGEVHIKPRDIPFEHTGLHIELVGMIICNEIDNYKSEFINIHKELEPAGEYSKPFNYNFSFRKVNLPYDSYDGVNISIKYNLKLTIGKRLFGSKYIIEKNFLVCSILKEPELNANVRMEIGIDNMIHLEYELFKSKYHLDDCVIGKIFFIKVNLNVRTIELHLIKRESIGHGNLEKSDNILISKYEIIDGKPDIGEMVAIRMHIGSYNLSPTFKEVNNMISIRYFLRLVIIDDDDKVYNKQQEIYLWRKNL